MPKKTKTKRPTKKIIPTATRIIPATNSDTNKLIIGVVVGCLSIFLLITVLIGALIFWTAWKVRKEVRRDPMPFTQEQPMDIFQEDSSAPIVNDNSEGFLPPSTSKKNMGNIKKVYTKNGKNYLDIDYIQWLTGDEAEKAMREDGQCPKTEECIVYDDYYIRNVNPQIRTFEVSPDVEITMQTLDSETTGNVNQNKKISFSMLQTIFTPGSANHDKYQNTPFIIELSNNKIVRILEQYIP